MTKNHFPWTRLWHYWKWRVWSEPFPSNAAVAEGPFEWRVLVPWSPPTLKWCFEEEVSLVILLQKKLKENKGRINNGYIPCWIQGGKRGILYTVIQRYPTFSNLPLYSVDLECHIAGRASASVINSRVNFFILYYDQQTHNYFTNYYTPTCFDTTVSSSDSL